MQEKTTEAVEDSNRKQRFYFTWQLKPFDKVVKYYLLLNYVLSYDYINYVTCADKMRVNSKTGSYHNS